MAEQITTFSLMAVYDEKFFVWTKHEGFKTRKEAEACVAGIVRSQIQLELASPRPKGAFRLTGLPIAEDTRFTAAHTTPRPPRPVGKAPSAVAVDRMKAFLLRFHLPPKMCRCGAVARGWNKLCTACNTAVRAKEGVLCPHCGGSYAERGGKGSGTFCRYCEVASNEMGRLMGKGRACPSCGELLERSLPLAGLSDLPAEWADMPDRIVLCCGCRTLWTPAGVLLTASEVLQVRLNAWDDNPTPSDEIVEVSYDLMYSGRWGKPERAHGRINALTRKLTQTG